MVDSSILRGPEPGVGFNQNLSRQQAQQVDNGEGATVNTENTSSGGDRVNLSEAAQQTSSQEATVSADTQSNEASPDSGSNQSSIANADLRQSAQSSSVQAPERSQQSSPNISEAQSQQDQTGGEADSGSNVDRFA